MSFPNYSSSRDWDLYSQIQTAFSVVNNSSGVWTDTGAQKLRFDSLTMPPTDPELINLSYKTGTSSPLPGIPGRAAGGITITKPFFPSGAAGTDTDDTHLLQGVFGQAPATVASTSVTYNFTDAFIYATLLAYNVTPGMSGPTNVYGHSVVPTKWKLEWNGKELTQTFDLMAVCVADSNDFSSNYTGNYSRAAGSLTTYPALPGSTTTTGNAITSFGGTATFASNQMYELAGVFTLEVSTGLEMFQDGFLDAFGIGVARGLRTVTGTFSFIDSDSTGLKALKSAAFTKAQESISIVLGSVAGQIVTVNFNNVQFGPQSWRENGARIDVSLGNAMAHPSSATTTNDATLVLT